MATVTIRISPELAEDIRLSQAIFERIFLETLNENLMAEFIPSRQRIIEGQAVVIDQPLIQLQPGS